MKKLTNRDLPYLKREFQKGNKYIFVTRVEEHDHQKFTIISEIKKGGVVILKEYDTLNNYRKVYDAKTMFRNWRWNFAIFTLLNKE
jgi:hypothetical protein